MTEVFSNSGTHLKQFPRLQGECDDTGRFCRAIQATPTGGLLLVPEGYYFVKEITVNKPLSIRFEGMALLEATDMETAYLFQFSGMESPYAYPLFVPAKRGERSVKIAGSPVDLNVGDMVVLRDDATRAGDMQADVNVETHEIADILLTDAYTEIVFNDFVRLPKAIASSGRNLFKVIPLDHVTVENFRYRLKEGAVRGIGILAKRVRFFHIHGLWGERGGESAVQIRQSLYSTVEHFHLQNPQVVGSGQGYGIQFYGGNNRVTIRDGTARGMRHAIDLEGTFDALVENVTDYWGSQASFMISHNGWCSDITFRHCKALHARSSGFVAESQGVRDPYALTHHNIQILDCEWQRDRNPDEPVGYGFGVWFKCPTSARIVNFRASYGDGLSTSPGQDNGAIRMLPNQCDITIHQLLGRGVRRGIVIAHTSTCGETDGANRIVLDQITLSHCQSAFFINHGDGKKIIIRNATLDHIKKNIFEGNTTGSYRAFTIDGLSISNSPGVSLFQVPPRPDAGTRLQGSIRRIQSDSSPFLYLSTVKNRLTLEDLLLNGDGECLILSGKYPPTIPLQLPDGLVEGQKLILSLASNHTLTLKSDKIESKTGTATIPLSPGNRTTFLIWLNGKWVHIT